MKKTTLKRILSLTAALVLCLPLVACGEKEQPADNEAVIPASVNESAGVGRDGVIQQRESTGHTILVDAGHGFIDTGCGDGYYSDGTTEKDINFAVATLLTERLKLLGYDAQMTHDGENLPEAASWDSAGNNRIFSASERAMYINTLEGIDYVISIHVNSLDSDTTVQGMHIYYQQTANKVNDWGGAIAASIADAIEEKLGEDERPMEKDGTDPNTSFVLTREIKYATNLLEIGFVTNPTDCANMVDATWQENLANAIADGIDGFFTERKQADAE